MPGNGGLEQDPGLVVVEVERPLGVVVEGIALCFVSIERAGDRLLAHHAPMERSP